MTEAVAPAPRQPLDIRLTGPVYLALIVCLIWSLWSGPWWTGPAAGLLLIPLIALFTPRVRRGRLGFVAVSLVLFAIAAATHETWREETLIALERGAFVAAYFATLATLRSAADTSPAIRACGEYLAHQPPGRRYIALSFGGQAFALLLNYGSVALLGSLATASAASEPDPERRRHRIRRMLLAVQRGFCSMLPWSPLAFAVALCITLVPGVKWGTVLPFALVTSVILVIIGWALDTIFKPRIPGPPATFTAHGTWHAVLPLVGLLVGLMTATILLHEASGRSVTSVVLLIVPFIAMAWYAIQAPAGGRIQETASRSAHYVLRVIPGYRDEALILSLAAFIGSLGATVIGPWVAAAGFDFTAVPRYLLLAVLIWMMPISGMVGMNPIMTATLVLPLLPLPAELGLTPTAIFMAVTSGWALSGSFSPYTATTLLLGNFAGVSARHVGLRWNGVYTALCGVAVTIWVFVVAAVGA